MACSGQSGSAPSSVPTEPTTASSPVTTTTEVEWRTVPAPLAEESEEKVRVRFVAYGDVDPNDDIPFGVIPDVRIFIINLGSELADWWDTIWDVEMGITSIAPGVQIQSTAENIEASPVNFVTTGSDRTAETYVELSNAYTICVVSPIADVIAGCNRRGQIGKKPRDYAYFVYFSHGSAYIDNEEDGSERYRRFLHEDLEAYSPFSSKPASVTFVSTRYTGSDIEPYVYFLAPGASVAIIDDADIAAWWAAVSDDGTAIRDGEFFSLAIPIYGEDPAYGIPYDKAAHERVLENISVRTISVDWPGIIETDLKPGDYLFCNFNEEQIFGCDYEDIAAAQKYIFRVELGIWPLSDSGGQQLLKEVEDWEIRPSLAGN